MSRLYLFFVFFIVFFSCKQKPDSRKPEDIGLIHKNNLTDISEMPVFSSFIPEGYSLLEQIKGDVNCDTIPDIILIIKKNGEDSLSSPDNPIKRKVLLLTGGINNSYQLAAQNENIVSYYGYDPNFIEAFTGLSIDSGSIVISHYGGFNQRWTRKTVFNYNLAEKNWYLSRDEFTTFEATDENIADEKILTEKDFGKVRFDEYNFYK